MMITAGIYFWVTLEDDEAVRFVRGDERAGKNYLTLD
jgi:hypothetical protein